jgi:biopolymer transport protein TolR
MKRRIRLIAHSQMNLVPYIDVMLVLLIIFMTTANLIDRSAVDLPKMSHAPQQQQHVRTVSLTISTNGAFTLLDNGRTSTAKDLNILLKSLNTLTDVSILLVADQTVPYHTVITALDILYAHKINNISLAIQQ